MLKTCFPIRHLESRRCSLNESVHTSPTSPKSRTTNLMNTSLNLSKILKQSLKDCGSLKFKTENGEMASLAPASIFSRVNPCWPLMVDPQQGRWKDRAGQVEREPSLHQADISRRGTWQDAGYLGRVLLCNSFWTSWNDLNVRLMDLRRPSEQIL